MVQVAAFKNDPISKAEIGNWDTGVMWWDMGYPIEKPLANHHISDGHVKMGVAIEPFLPHSKA